MLRAIFLSLAFIASMQAQPAGDGFALPDGAIHRFGNRQMRHPEPIGAATVSSDGKLLATLSGNVVVIWDTQTLKARHTLKGVLFGTNGAHQTPRVTFYPDSKSLLVSVRVEDNIAITPTLKVELAQVYDLETGKLKFGVQGLYSFMSPSWLCNDHKEIGLLAGYQNTACVSYFDAKDGKHLRTVKLPGTRRGVWVSPANNRLANPSMSNNSTSIAILDGLTANELHTIDAAQIIQLAFTPDGKRVIVHDQSGKVQVHDIDGKKKLFEFDHPADKQRGPMRVSKDQNTLYFGGQHGQLYRWDLKNNKRLPDVGRHSSWTLSTIALSPDESILYSMGGDKLIRRWNLKTGEQLPLPEGYITQTAIAATPDGKHVIVADHAGAIDYWDLATGKHVKQLQPGKFGGIDCLTISQDGKWLAGGRTMQDVQLWNLETGKLERTIPLVAKPDEKGSDHVKRVVFRSDGKVLFTASGKTGITAWEVATCKQLWRAGNIGPQVACSPDGKRLAVGGGFADRIIWTLLDADTGAVLRSVEVVSPNELDNGINYPPYIGDISFTPDGTKVLSTHFDNRIRIWDLDNGQLVRTLVSVDMRNVGNPQMVVAYSPDGRWLGIGHANRQVKLWELASGQEVLTLTGFDSFVRDLVFTRDGRGVIANAELSPSLWSLTPKDLPSVDGPSVWEALAAKEADKAYRTQWALSKNSAIAIKLFAAEIKPGELSVARLVFDQWVEDLDSPQFRARELAEKNLTSAGFKVSPGWLRQALESASGDEVRARLTRVLAARDAPDPQEWRLGRAVQVLELAGTVDAKTLLKSWANATGSAVSKPAAAALKRLR